MSGLIKYITQYNAIWFSTIMVILAGIVGHLAGATMAFILLFIITKNYYKPFLFLIAALAIFYLSDNLSPQFAYVKNFRFVILAIGLVYLFNFQIMTANPGNLLIPFSAIATVFSFLYSPLGLDAILRGMGFWVVAIVIFRSTDLVYDISPKEGAHILIAWLLLFFSLNLLLNFYSFIPGAYVGGRFSGIMGNPNGLGLLTLISYPFIDLFKARKETELPNRFFNWLKVLLIIVAITTASRNAILSILIYEGVMRISGKAIWLITGILLMGVIWYFLFNTDIVSIIHWLGLSDYFRVESLETLSGRTEVWEVVWDEIKKSPWLGKGMLYDQYFVRQYVENNLSGVIERHWSGVWNSYLSLLMDVGIIGLMAYAYFFFKMYQIAQYKHLALPFIIMILFSGITESWLAASMNAFFPMFILYWAIQMQPLQNEDKS